MSEPRQRRFAVLFAGRVQGVGFRVTARTIAQTFAVTGFVQNLPDGRVELVAEGDKKELVAFVAGIQDRMGHLIEDCKQSELDASGEFTDFRIRH